MATSNVYREVNKSLRVVVNGVQKGNYMLLSTTYALNNSDTKRIQIGLHGSDREAVFHPKIKLSGGNTSGLYFDQATWEKFQQHLEPMSSYLRGEIPDAPKDISFENITIKFTSAYGEKAIMLCSRAEKGAVSSAAKSTNTPHEPTATKKQRIYSPGLVMQEVTFEGLRSVVSCLNVRYKLLESIARNVNECTMLLTKELELRLPKNNSLNADLVRRTLEENYKQIEETVRQSIKDLQFLDVYFELVFCELTSVHLYEIVKQVIVNLTS